MKNRSCYLPLFTLLLLALPAVLTADPLPINDNTAAPFKAVYRWGQGGCMQGKYDAYGPWLNRKVIWAEDFMPIQTWDGIEGQQWQLGTWKSWVQKVPGRRLVLSLPVLVGSWDGKGPYKGMEAKVPVSLEEGAKGTYNDHFKHLAENLVKYELGDTIIRVGWEFNGGWYIWRAQTAGKAKAFAEYFKQIVTTMRSVPGTENLKFVWNPAMEPWWPYPPETAWPGDDVVDYVGVDVYDQSWGKNTYPFPKDAKPEEILTRQKRTWDNITNNEKANGLPYWVKFAAQHGKPLVIPEWGVCLRGDKHGGLDNPFYVQQMFDFIHDPANNVFFECYFDVGAPDGDHQLCPDPNGKRQTKFPESAAKYKELFTLPVAPAPAPAAAP